MKPVIIPTILVSSFSDFKKKVTFIEPYFKLAQIDIMDGKFVKNKTFFNLQKIRQIKTPLNYELHLMVNNPLPIIMQWGSFNKVKKIIFHIESCNTSEQIHGIIKEIKKYRCKVGIALNPQTSIKKVEPFIRAIDTIMIMGVNPGKSGQKFKPAVLRKIKSLRTKYPKKNIEIDGGVNLKTIRRIIKAGANLLSAGSLIHNSKNLQNTIANINHTLKNSKI